MEISATGAGNTAPDASLTLDATSGSVPLPVKATIAGSDAERDPLTYTLDFGDGTTPVRGDLPQDPVGHTYDKVGTYLVRLAVSDGKLSTVKTATVVVGLDQPLAADAGDDQVAVVGATVHFEARIPAPPPASTPTTGPSATAPARTERPPTTATRRPAATPPR